MDTDRLVIYESLKVWCSDPVIRNLIETTDVRLLFNADETSICRIIDAAEKVVCTPKEKPTVPSQLREGNHTTLFLIISAAGFTVEPYVILHSEREEFVNNSLYNVKTYRTAKWVYGSKDFH